MIKSVTQVITTMCNSKCQMCSIWKSKDFSNEMTLEDYEKLYSKVDFSNVEDFSISGGEPTLRKDLLEITDVIIKNLKNLKMLFLNTNCSNPEKIRNFVSEFSPKIKDLYLCLSIEGDRETNKKIRGVDSFENIIKTIKLVKSLNKENCKIILSTTLVRENCNKKNIEYLKKLADDLDCNFTFRPASQNNSYYKNRGQDDFLVSKDQLNLVKEYISESNDPFLKILKRHIDGEETIMWSRKNGITCQAGEIVVFVKENGDIYPCINSQRKIGDKESGIVKKQYTLGNMEDPCPCCTECQVYPKMNNGNISN